jgi:predicted Fe-Mo cluster-binding NifX family protein
MMGRREGEELRERIVIPAEDENGLNARLSEHFGRAPYFIIVELEDGSVTSVQVVPNESEHFGGFGLPSDRILQVRPNAIITYGIGPRALSIFHRRTSA